MIDSLTDQKKQIFSNILFNNNEEAALRAVYDISNPEDMAILKHIYDQKIAFEATYIPIKPPKPVNEQNEQSQENPIPSLISTFCFCLFPEDNRELFDITNQIFLKRFFAVFLFWKKNFLSVGGGKAQLYGPIWITLGYIAIMGFMGNFSIYMVDSLSFQFMQQHYANAFGTVLIFTMAEILFYPSVLTCLGGFIVTKEAVCIIGYSLALYYIPTVLCMFTSLAWYTTCLFGEGLIRAIFLFRNFSTKIESRTYVLLIVFILVECLYAYILLQTTFFKYSGYTYDEGINQLTGAATVVFPSDQKIPGVYQPPASGAVGSAGVAIHTLIRSFIN